MGPPDDVLEAGIVAKANEANAAGVPSVTGDTKVVERGKCDKLYITTTGIGLIGANTTMAPELVRPGDKIIVSGTIGDHGVAIMLARGHLDIEADVRSDTQPLWALCEAMLAVAG